ncbi:MAG: arginine repressor [Bacteroidota bacterium]
MKNKNERLLQIRRLINNERIASQEELLNLLKEKGFSMTQATLSRDLKHLRVSKVFDEEKGYIYFLPEEDNHSSVTPWSGFLIEGFVSLEFAQGLFVMKTLPGYANSIGSAMDSMNLIEIAGTIAGDDTILIIPRDGVKKEDIQNQLGKVIPNI